MAQRADVLPTPALANEMAVFAMQRRNQRFLLRHVRHLTGRALRDFQAEAKCVMMEMERLETLGLSPEQWRQELERSRLGLRLSAIRPDARQACPRYRALALIACSAARALGLRPYENQVLSALAMHDGYLVQLAPGEGKSLSVALAAVLYAWTDGGVHVVTSNEYLAGRDAEEMDPLYRLCGCPVAALKSDIDVGELAARYQSAIVYATGQQLLADYLRDQLLMGGVKGRLRRRIWDMKLDAGGRKPVMQRLRAAIVDEADSVLIDEATTPLIISYSTKDSVLSDAIHAALSVVDGLKEAEHYTVVRDGNSDVQLTPKGIAKVDERGKAFPAFWQESGRREDLVRTVLMARECFKRDHHYVIQQGRVVIVDENSGRIMADRSWSYGIHQAIEAMEGLEVTAPTRTVARMTFQSFFCLYPRLSGTSGTLQGIAAELRNTYKLLTLNVPTRRPLQRTLAPVQIFRNREDKLQALVNNLETLHRKGLPVLVGTRRISDSEDIARRVLDRGMHCEVLNAKYHEEEARIVAQSGRLAHITVATNMAGRGTDIKLSPGVSERGGLQVLMFEPHGAARVDWQLIGRSGRQGAPGHAQLFVALDDELLCKSFPFWTGLARFAGLLSTLSPNLFMRIIQFAQWRSQRRAWLARKNMRKRDESLDEQLSFSSKPG